MPPANITSPPRRMETPDRDRLRPLSRVADWRDICGSARARPRVRRQVVGPIRAHPFADGDGTFFEPTRLVDEEGWIRRNDQPWWEADLGLKVCWLGLYKVWRPQRVPHARGHAKSLET